MLLVGLLQSNGLTLLPPEVSEGRRGCHLGVVGVILVSYPEYTRVYTLVSYPGYTRVYILVSYPECTRVYTGVIRVSSPSHTQFSRHTWVSGDQAAAGE